MSGSHCRTSHPPAQLVFPGPKAALVLLKPSLCQPAYVSSSPNSPNCPLSSSPPLHSTYPLTPPCISKPKNTLKGQPSSISLWLSTCSTDSGTERVYQSTSHPFPSSDLRMRHSRDGNDNNLSGSQLSNSVDPPDPAQLIPYWSTKCHLTCGNPSVDSPWSSNAPAWCGSAPGKLKTANTGPSQQSLQQTCFQAHNKW